MIFSRRQFLCAAAASVLPATDEAFLEDLSQRAFLFFWEQAAARTGLTLDRTRNAGQRVTGVSEEVASLASTGFALTALCIGHARKWRPPDEIRERVRLTLRHLADDQPHVARMVLPLRGTAHGRARLEIGIVHDRYRLAACGSADGAAVLCFRWRDRAYGAGDLRARRFRLDARPATLCLRMGWRPESGFLRAIWGEYRENAILYLLGIASPLHPIPVRSWYAFAATRWSLRAIGSLAPDRFLRISSRMRGWTSGDSAMGRRSNWITSRTR